MKAKEIRELTAEEIRKHIADVQAELQDLRFKHTIANLEDPVVLRRKRRELGRLKTLLREKA